MGASVAVLSDKAGLPDELRLKEENGLWRGRFTAMASPCELLIEDVSAADAANALRIAFAEARRVERKFSRYRSDSIIARIHASRGQRIAVDDETAGLLDFADECYNLSGGLFDITSGVLRKVWRFDGSDHLPDAEEVQALLPSIGWKKVTWRAPYLLLPEGMELDLGGIGKEYAVDRTAALIGAYTKSPFLVNYGGDLYVRGPRQNGQPWQIGIDDPVRTGEAAVGKVELARGGLATSGDARRFLLKDGVRYSHILNPKTGWPVEGAPRSVTVAAPTCIEAGMIATIAMLNGVQAGTFLKAQRLKYWCVE
jgi:thiamine biosynthesis lipoprotein